MAEKPATGTNDAAFVRALRKGVRALSLSSTNNYSSFAQVEVSPFGGLWSAIYHHFMVICFYITAVIYVVTVLSGISNIFTENIPLQLWNALLHGNLLFFFGTIILTIGYLFVGLALGIVVKFYTKDLLAYYAYLRRRRTNPHYFPLNAAQHSFLPSLWLSSPRVTLMQPADLKALLEKDEEHAMAQADALLATMDIVEKDDQPSFHLILTLTDHITMTMMTPEGKQATKEIRGAYAAPLFYLAAQPKGASIAKRTVRKALYPNKSDQIFGLHRKRCNDDVHALARMIGLLPAIEADSGDAPSDEAEEAQAPGVMDEALLPHDHKGLEEESTEETSSTANAFDLFQNTRENQMSCWQLLPHCDVVEYPLLNAFYEQMVRAKEANAGSPEEEEAALPLTQVRQQVARVWGEYGKGYAGENQPHYQKMCVPWPWVQEPFAAYRDKCLKIFQYAATRELAYAPTAPSDKERIEASRLAAKLYGWSAFVAAGLIPHMESATEAFGKCIHFYKEIKHKGSAKSFCDAYKEHMEEMDYSWEVPDTIRAIWPQLFPSPKKKQQGQQGQQDEKK